MRLFRLVAGDLEGAAPSRLLAGLFRLADVPGAPRRKKPITLLLGGGDARDAPIRHGGDRPSVAAVSLTACHALDEAEHKDRPRRRRHQRATGCARGAS
jgi:hypothetical protein